MNPHPHLNPRRVLVATAAVVGILFLFPPVERLQGEYGYVGADFKFVGSMTRFERPRMGQWVVHLGSALAIGALLVAAGWCSRFAPRPE